MDGNKSSGQKVGKNRPCKWLTALHLQRATSKRKQTGNSEREVPPVSVEMPRRYGPPPPRPPRPDSLTIRNVHAWLNATRLRPSPVSQTSISYLRVPTILTDNIPSRVELRYADPVEQGYGSRATHHRIRFDTPGCKKTQVKMPFFLRSCHHKWLPLKPQDSKSKTNVNPNPKASNSMLPISGHPAQPLIHFLSCTGPEIIPKASPVLKKSKSAFLTRHRQPFTTDIKRGFHSQGKGLAQPAPPQEPPTYERLAVARDPHSSLGTERETSRQGSLANLSDAPTYFTEIQPPSYRTDAASIRTTSSFGCVDGFNHRRRPGIRGRGVRHKLSNLAQALHLN